MSFLPEPSDVVFEKNAMRVSLDDGRTITVSLDRYPSLLNASQKQRADFWLSPGGIHWDDVDEDISVEGLFAVGTVASRRAA